MPRLLLLAPLAALVGCASTVSSLPPDSQIDVAARYRQSDLSDAALAVVVGAVAVSDDGVATHVGGAPGAAEATYASFFAEQLPVAFRTARIGEVHVVEPPAYDRAGDGPRPAPGVRLDVGGFVPDLVLFLDTLQVDRATYWHESMTPSGPNGTMMMTRSKSEALRLDTDVVLWDNEAGAEVAAGRLEAERTLPPVGRSRDHYEDAVREFVEQLARFTPIELRE